MLIGTDIIELERISQALTRQSSFANKVLSQKELTLYETFNEPRQIEFLAGRFCAKEAYVKALGIGFRSGFKMSDISVLPNQWGQPELQQGPWIQSVAMSISHSKTVAMATCVIDAHSQAIHQQLLKEGIKL